MNRTNITDTQIRTLREEASLHGDPEMVTVCDRALAGDSEARSECARVIADVAWLEGDDSRYAEAVRS